MAEQEGMKIPKSSESDKRHARTMTAECKITKAGEAAIVLGFNVDGYPKTLSKWLVFPQHKIRFSDTYVIMIDSLQKNLSIYIEGITYDGVSEICNAIEQEHVNSIPFPESTFIGKELDVVVKENGKYTELNLYKKSTTIPPVTPPITASNNNNVLDLSNEEIPF